MAKKNRTAWRTWGTPLLVALLLLTGWFSYGLQTVYGITAYIDAQPEQAEVGQDVTVTVVFSGDDVGRVRATLDYDTSVLSYQGEEGDSGTVSLYMAGVGEDISYSLPFKAVGGGESTLVLTPLNAYDLDERSIGLPETQVMSVTVKAEENTAPQPDPKKDEGDKSDSEKDGEGDSGKDGTQDKDQPDQTPDKQPAPESHTSATVLILCGLAAVLAVVLIIVLVRRAKSRHHE